jgi:hypothetical protein
MDRNDGRAAALASARIGALALAIGASANLGLHLAGPALGPVAFLFWLVLSFGILAFCSEMGAERPLNRAGLVLFAAAFIANTAGLLSTEAEMVARARLLYAFTVLGAVGCWSAALLHRTGPARMAGSVGAWLGGSALALLLAAHLLVGVVTIFGFSQLFAAVDHQAADPRQALTVIDAILCAWSLTAAGLLWADRLRSTEGRRAR